MDVLSDMKKELTENELESLKGSNFFIGEAQPVASSDDIADDFEVDFGDDFSDFKKDGKEITENKSEETTADVEMMTVVWLLIFDFIISKTYERSGGQKKYSLDSKNRDDYKKVCIAYFETLKSKPSPLVTFLTSTVSLGFMAYQKGANELKQKQENDRLRNENERLRKELESKKGAKVVSFNDEKATEKVEKVVNKRKRFETDENGYYEYNEKGKYIKKADRAEKPTWIVQTLINENMSNKEIISRLKDE